MSPKRLTELIVVAAGLLTVCACTGPPRVAHNFSARQLQGVDRNRVFQIAEAEVLARGYQIAQRDPEAGLLTTVPVFDEPQDQPVRLRARPETRRVLELRLVSAADAVSVRCRIVVEEQSTEAYRFFASGQRGDDTPTDTPIERDAATTTEQNTVWRAIRRDKITERQILIAISEAVERTTSSSDP